MESEISFLPDPRLDIARLPYIVDKKRLYVNLYEINIKKLIKIYKYPYSVKPEIVTGDLGILDKLFKACNWRLKEVYGECFISGNSLYGLKKVNENREFTTRVYLNRYSEYIINFQKYTNERILYQENVQNDQLTNQFIEITIKDILLSNPKLDFYKGLFIRNDQEKQIKTDKISIKVYPGFTTSFTQTEGGNFLNVTLKNKIIQTDTVLDFLIDHKYKNKENQEEIKNLLIGRSFKVPYAKKNYLIDDVLFDKNPQNQNINHDGQEKNLIQYYEDAHKLNIKDISQPLLLVKRKGPQEQEINFYFIPELCNLVGLDKNVTKNGRLMRELKNYTKLRPTERVEEIKKFLQLLNDSTRNPNHPASLSAKEKSELYGIEVKPVDQLFDAYYMKETNFIGGGKKIVNVNRTFPVLDKVDMTSWLCFYEESNYNDAENLYKNLAKAAKAFKLNIAEPKWIEMPNKSNVKDWIVAVDEFIGNGKIDYSFVVFLLGNYNEHFFPDLKRHSFAKNGYVSQVVRAITLKKKGILSICSKILLQINAKLRGNSNIATVQQNFFYREIMIVGVSSSHVKGQRTGVGMVASINKDFTDFFNKESIINEEKKEQICYCVRSFLEEAITNYLKENKKSPENIIIYRQGVSLEQKEFLKSEIQQIDQFCKSKNIKYYYILVNTKKKYKFFEKDGKTYNNPKNGLLIMDGITNINFFEFYIQPQQVTGGSATPTCFHVAYGNMGSPEMIPKITYDLCHIYNNWHEPLRIPNVLRNAEKLSKMIAKYEVDELNEN